MKKKSVSLLIGLFLLISTPVVYGEETIFWSDLVEHDGIYYKVSTNTDSSPSLVLFSGKVTGEHQGNMKNGKREGPWIQYWDNGQIRLKGIYKDGEKVGDDWVEYAMDGSVL